MNNNAVV